MLLSKVGSGPQISSANRKSRNLQTYQICQSCWPFANVAILWICDLEIQYFAELRLPLIRKNLIYLLANNSLKVLSSEMDQAESSLIR